MRRDAADNRQRLLTAATSAIHHRGASVPLADVAAAACVGIGTLYRHFPDRDALIDELTWLSYERVLANAHEADRAASDGLDAISRFLDAAVRDRERLVLPMHGGGAVSTERTAAARRRVATAVSGLVARGKVDGSVGRQVQPRDVVLFGAMLAQPHPPVADWVVASRRIKKVYLRGLAP